MGITFNVHPVDDSPPYHFIAWVRVLSPAGQRSPIIVTDGGDILQEASWFFGTAAVQGLSKSWKEKAAKYIGKFYDYFRARQKLDRTFVVNDRWIDECIMAFRFGTKLESGDDPLRLFWSPWSASNISFAISVLKRFCLSTADMFGEENQLARSAFALSTTNAYATEQRKFRSQLLHLHARTKDSGSARDWRPNRISSVQKGSAKSFQRDLIGPLLFEGCQRPRLLERSGSQVAARYNLSLMLTITLLAGGGLRRSEPFHIFVDDVRHDEVRLYDPIRGQMSWIGKMGRPVSGPRDDYLKEVCGRVPRSLTTGGQHAGWKSMLMDHGAPYNYSLVQWIDPNLKKLFFSLFDIYIQQARPNNLKHPYLLVSLDKTNFGQPWTISSFDQAFTSAVRRIGQIPDARSGINPHGLRHLYGQTLTDIGLKPIIIQHAMHHKSIESQLVYTRPSVSKVTDAIERANEKNKSDFTGWTTDPLWDHVWKSDPLNILSSWNLGSLT